MRQHVAAKRNNDLMRAAYLLPILGLRSLLDSSSAAIILSEGYVNKLIKQRFLKPIRFPFSEAILWVRSKEIVEYQFVILHIEKQSVRVPSWFLNSEAQDYTCRDDQRAIFLMQDLIGFVFVFEVYSDSHIPRPTIISGGDFFGLEEHDSE